MKANHDPNGSAIADSLSDGIARSIEEDIIFGRLKPGEKLPEEELSVRFTASRHQVREALANLQLVGIVVKERNRGVSVRRFSTEEVLQMYDVREILQRQATLMIQLPVPKHVIDRLGLIHAEHEHAISRRNYRAIHETNDRFHIEFFRLCGNDFLWQLIKQYMDLSYTIRANAFNLEHQRLAHQEHAVMISLLGTRNSWALAQLCVDHIQYSKQQYLTLLQPQETLYGPSRRHAGVRLARYGSIADARRGGR
jgi:DNA-binding GntR family transcriptional regulator